MVVILAINIFISKIHNLTDLPNFTKKCTIYMEKVVETHWDLKSIRSDVCTHHRLSDYQTIYCF